MNMDAVDLLTTKVTTLNNLLSALVSTHGDTFSQCSKIIGNALKNEKVIFWCGNGGSAAESSHLAVELIGRFKNNRRSLPSLSLNSDTSAITCIANDFGYNEIFARQLEGLGKKGDVLIVLSSSGKSENIVRVLRKAKEIGITSIALLGKGGGLAVDLADFAIVVQSDETARIQEMHLLLGHTLCEYAEIELGIA
jgi:D-sedoheptulose 7-phosphate isomerase